MLVIAAASYALVVRFSAGGVSGVELKSAARAVAAGLRDARGTAIATQESAALTLDLEHRSMEVSGGRRARTLPQRLDLKLYTAQSEIVDEKRGAIRFYPGRQLHRRARDARLRAKGSCWSTWTGSPAA